MSPARSLGPREDRGLGIGTRPGSALRGLRLTGMADMLTERLAQAGAGKPSARVAVELTAQSALALVDAIRAAIAAVPPS